MLIFGNKDNLKVGSDVQEIFVDYCVERLVHCSAPATGWKHCIALMVEFLEDCVSQHRIYKDNELMRSSQFLHNEVQKSKSKSLLEFARDQFTLLASPLKTCMITFSTHLPRNFINDQKYQGIVKLISLLDSIELLLFEDSSMTSSELEAIFLQKVVIGSESFVGRSSLTYIRSECLSVLRSLKISLDNLGLKKLTDRTSTMEFCFQKASMIFCTTSSSYKLHSLNTEPFHLLVIDEAAQLKECETTIALQISEVRHAILVGDEMQLPATVSSKLLEKAGFRRSLFERLSSMGHLKHMLNVQYRMHPSISRFPNSKFYFNQILDAPNVQSESYERCYLEGRMFGSYSFINIRGGREELDDDGHSMRNLVEVAVVWKLVGKLFKVSVIRDRILPKYDSYEGFKVKVMSIDGFQGGEADVIIISTVRSHKGGSIGFLSSPQRTNVALTRARTLSKSGSAWAALVADAKNRQCFFNADEICDVWKTIIDVNKELDQLDDLVSWESLHFENSRWEVLFSENFKSSFLKLKSSGVKKLALGLVLKVASDDFVNHCKEKLFEGHLEIPKTWSLCDDIIRFKNRSKTGANNWSEVCASNVENSEVSESLLLMKFYSLSTGAANYLLSDHKGREVDLPFEVTEEEREIILFPRSSFILGRSGTGKTTILTMKLFQKHQLHCIASRDSTAADNNVHISNKIDAGHYLDESKGITLHQLFVTVSPKLCYAVKSHISQLISFARENFSGSMNVTGVNDIDEMADFNDIPDTFVGFPQEKYPLIITFQKFLMMLDGTLGDTAQTIARGIDFRFQDIRSLFYNEFLMKSRNCQVSGSREKGIVSASYCLSQNFRTHTGVLRLAQSVIDLICRYFPQSIDSLDPETSRVYGESPVVLKPGCNENSIISIFGQSAKSGRKWVGFGADQVILVRDDSARNEIFSYVGNQALVLTVMECKGLEFQGRSDHVQVRDIDDSLAETMQRASRPEEWKSRGIKLFWEKNYEMAALCFEKAGEEAWEKRVKASQLRAAADCLRDSSSKEANIKLREAAEIFDSINCVESAVKCFCDLGDYDRAGWIYLEKCGMTELTKAGECFSLARNYKIAAEVYAMGNLFRECIAACANGNYFDKGLQYIENWKKQASWNSAIMARIPEINKIAQEFLENNALKCYRSKDNASLLKIVRAFPSMESKRKFLKSLDCHGELLVLEEESGNFNMAAEIARRLGYILREIDLLEKAEKFADACMLILYYVLSNSLWVSGSRGWPLKSFPKKAELLNRAMSISKKVPGTFPASICAEAEILLPKQSNLSEILQCYRASKKYESLSGEILSVRKLLDGHFQVNQVKYELDSELHLDPESFDGIISRNQVSVGTLAFVWNLWKEHSLTILDCLDRIAKLDFIKSEGTVQFCFNYCGVRKLQDNAAFHLLNPDAAWARNVVKNFTRNKVVTVEAYNFAPAAREFWHQELISVGFRVLDVLQVVYKSCKLSKCSQSMCLLHIFDIAKFFLGSESVKLKDLEAIKLRDFLKLSCKFFDFVFPLDFRQSFTANMISLREAELSRSLLEEIFCRNIRTMSKLTYRQIGCAVMILLGYGKPKYSLFVKIAERLPMDSSWKSFIENLRRTMESDSVDVSDLSNFVSKGAVSESETLPSATFVAGVPLESAGCSPETLSHELHEALQETYNANWRTYGYISPNCFFYLVQRLLDLVPHSQGFFFTSKSSFVEYLMCLPSDGNPIASLFKYKNSYSAHIVEFAVRVVEHSLLNIEETAEWISISNLDSTYYLPVMMLKMIVILCLLCLNWDVPLDRLYEKLTVPHIRAQLPSEFHGALQRSHKNGTSFLAAVVEALEIIGDPLVIVDSIENDLKFACPNAIFLDLRSFSCKNEIMKALLSMNTDMTTTVKSLEKASKFDTYLCSENGGDRNMQINCSILREMSDALESLISRGDGDLKSFVLRKKVELEEQVKVLAVGVAQLAEQRCHSGEYEDLYGEASNMIEEFHMLFSLVDTSEFNVEEIEEVLKKLEARTPQVRRLLMQNGMSVVSEDRKGNLSNQRGAECSQRKGKNKKKKNNKSRKGKGGGPRK
ncbi:hypothetical protein C2S51_026992 [Perilla frutescens var. frutescens]|nr:hypothetical protein C2S51_026992 [Perilla frutescens var. frutescens]